VKRRKVIFAPEARADLSSLYDWLADAAGPEIALTYIERIETWCLRLDLASERGHIRDDIRPGLRIVGFEQRITVAFIVDRETVSIIRLFRGGRDWEREFRD
jgi:toxin ParE1/3/4